VKGTVWPLRETLLRVFTLRNPPVGAMLVLQPFLFLPVWVSQVLVGLADIWIIVARRTVNQELTFVLDANLAHSYHWQAVPTFTRKSGRLLARGATQHPQAEILLFRFIC
jgi:hypothetical protein